MFFVADLEGREVNVGSRDRVLQVLHLVVAKVRIPGDEQLQVHEVPTDLVNIYCIIIEVCFFS